MTLISARDSAHDFIAKCSAVASLSGEVAAQSFAYRAHETADSGKFSCYQWFVWVPPIISTLKMSTPRMSTPKMSTPRMSTPKIFT